MSSVEPPPGSGDASDDDATRPLEPVPGWDAPAADDAIRPAEPLRGWDAEGDTTRPIEPLPPPGASALSRHPWLTWLIAFVGFFLLSAAWALASPMATSPDEPAHIVKAAASARGEFVKTTERHTVEGIHVKDWLGFRLPAKYKTVDAMSLCFRGKVQTSAACGQPFGTDDTETIVETSAGQYNPLYYYPVGLPSLFLPGVSALYGMRLVSAAVGSALLAAAVAIAATWPRPGWPKLGVVACATPMALFLNGTVNPNGLEVSSAVLAWTAAVSLVLDPRPERVAARVSLLALGGVLLANTRELGVPFLAVVLLAALVVASRSTFRTLARRWSVGFGGLVLVIGIVTAELWDRYAATLTTSRTSFPDLTPGKAAEAAFFGTGQLLNGMIGDLGWLDVPLPPGSAIAWWAVSGLLVLTAVGVGRAREALVLAALVVGVVVLPLVAQVLTAKQLGLGWQGRYTLAWAVGAPVLGALAVARYSERALGGWLDGGVYREPNGWPDDGIYREPNGWPDDGIYREPNGWRDEGVLREPNGWRDEGIPREPGGGALRGGSARFDRRVPAAAAVVLGLAGIAAFFWSMLRYGHGGPPPYLPTHLAWRPPGGWALSWVLYLLGAVTITILVAARGDPSRGAV